MAQSDPNSPSCLTKQELQLCREQFKFFDKNNDGHIDAKEIKAVLKQCSMFATDQEIKEIVREADKNGNGTIEFDEFVKAMASTKGRQSIISVSDESFVDAFYVFDKDKDGFITRAEMEGVVHELHLDHIYTQPIIDAMFNAADINHDDKITREEFLIAMKSDLQQPHQ